MDIMNHIIGSQLAKNETAITWLGQAGFIIKQSDSNTIAIDPYLSDCCEREFGFKRLSPKLIAPDELQVDVLFSTHEHYDHFDIDAVPDIMKHKKTRFIGSKTAAKLCADLGIDPSRITALSEGGSVDTGWAKFTAVYADHGDLAPDALGVMIQIGNIKIYYTGDTAYRPEKMQTAIKTKPDIIILPINGAYGNLNAREAAMLARDTGAKIAVPCHFWTFAIHGGDPQAFADEMKSIAPACEAKFLCQGETFTYRSKS